MQVMYLTFGLYLVMVLGIGVWAYFYTKNFNDYVLGGRRLGSFVTAMAAGASDMSGWLLMGLPGAVFVAGLSEAWIAIGLIIGAYFNWLLVAGRLRVHTELSGNSLTLPEYFFNRFGEKDYFTKAACAVIILFFFTIYCSSGIVAGARLFQTLFPNISYSTAIILGAGATIAYTFIGGFLAVSWTDTVQASLMIFALILTPVMIFVSLGGFAELSAVINTASAQNNVNYGNLLSGVSILGIISSAAWGLGYFGQPHILVRFMAAKNAKTARNARIISITWMFLCLGGAIAVGYFGIAYFSINPENAGLVKENAERIFMSLAQLLFNPWIAGIILSAILAAVMSTLSAQLLVSSSTLTEDIYKGFIRKNASQKELIWIGRIMVLVIAAIAIFIASNPDSKVFSLVSYAWAGFGASFGPVVILSVLWWRMTGKGAAAGMIVGALTVFLWANYIKPYFPLYEIVPAFILSAITTIIVSLKDKEPNSQIVERFNQANKKYYLEITN